MGRRRGDAGVYVPTKSNPNSWVLRARVFGLLGLQLLFGAIAVLLYILALPITLFVDPYGNFAHCTNCVLTRMAIAPFLKYRIVGKENLPKDRPMVIALNHQSTLDAFVLALLPNINFRAMIKKEILYYPIMGQLFLFAWHVAIERSRKDDKGKAARHKALEDAKSYISDGKLSFLFFPEGTRYIDLLDGPLGAFKPGAFIAAYDTNTAVLPVTLSGMRANWPLKGFPEIGYEEVVITVHKPVEVDEARARVARGDFPEGEEGDSLYKRKVVTELSDMTRDSIVSALQPRDYYAGRAWISDEGTFMKHWKGPESSVAANRACGVVRALEDGSPAEDVSGVAGGQGTSQGGQSKKDTTVEPAAGSPGTGEPSAVAAEEPEEEEDDDADGIIAAAPASGIRGSAEQVTKADSSVAALQKVKEAAADEAAAAEKARAQAEKERREREAAAKAEEEAAAAEKARAQAEKERREREAAAASAAASSPPSGAVSAAGTESASTAVQPGASVPGATGAAEPQVPLVEPAPRRSPASGGGRRGRRQKREALET